MAGYVTRTWQSRFYEKIRYTDICWFWVGALNWQGYPRFFLHGKKRAAHRIAYEWFIGPIPDGLTIDHLCRNRACVNPEHMEAVPLAVNTLRGEAPSARNARKTHCPQGHPLFGANLYRTRAGTRQCRTCRNAQKRRARAAA